MVRQIESVTAAGPNQPSKGGPHGQSTGRRQDPRFHARAVGPDLHAAAGMVRRRRDQGRASRRRRHHARTAAGHPQGGQPLLHDAEPQQALDHHRQQEQEGHGDPGAPREEMRRAGRELRAWRARPHGAHLGAHPAAQSADDLCAREGFRPRPLRGLQGLRERRPMHGRVGLHHRLPRWPAAGDRRADRRQRHRPAPGARHRHGPLSPHHVGQGPARHLRHAGRRAQPRAREDARSAAPGARAAHRVQPARRGHSVRQGRAARRQRLRAAASRDASSSARAGRPIPTPTSISSRRRRCGRRSAT